MPSEQATEFQRKRQDKWLDAFDAASPLERHRLLREALEAPKPILTPDAMAFVAATVNQMLAHSNQLDELESLTLLLERQSPAAHAMLQPALLALELNLALYRQQQDRLPLLMRQVVQLASHLPAQQLQLILDQLASFGHVALAAESAALIQQRLGPALLEIEEELDYVLETHQLYRVIETYWRSEGDETARRQLAIELRQALEDETDVRFFRRQAEASEAELLARLKESLMQRDVSAALSHAQLAFGRWMLKQHDLPLYISAKMLQEVFVIWTQPPLKGSLALDRLTRLEPRQLNEAFEIYEFDGDDLLQSFYFVWGLPQVYAWLAALGFGHERENEKIQAFSESCKPEIYHSRGLALWSFDFVHSWPRPPLLSEADWSAEIARFRARFAESLPLSDNPGDNQYFDEQEDAFAEAEAGLSEEMIVELLVHLQSLRPEQQEHLLGVLAIEYGPEAAETVRVRMHTAADAGETPKKSKSSRKKPRK